MALSAFSVPGSISVGLNEPSSLLNAFSKDITSQVLTATIDGLVSESVTYYIKYVTDINQHITYNAGDPPEATGNDDAWGLTAFTVASTDGTYDPAKETKNLPTSGGAVSVQAGVINIQHPDGGVSGTFTVNLALTVDNQLNMTATASVTGNDVTVTVDNVPNQIQVVHINIPGENVPATPTENDSDVLSDSVAATTLQALFSNGGAYETEINNIIGNYDNLDLVDSWSIAFTEITQAVDSVLSHHARGLDPVPTSNQLFAAGDKIVTSGKADVKITITDYAGDTQNVVGSGGDRSGSYSVYGILEQQAAV